MMDTVYEALTTEKHAVIEGGTGIGKSLAYLLPTLYFSINRNQPVMISTYTIQMQDQILNNEIGRLSKIVPFPFRASILKGRSNYLNMLKFEQSLREDEVYYDSVMAKMQLLVWLIYTNTGDLDELNLSGGPSCINKKSSMMAGFFRRKRIHGIPVIFICMPDSLH